jgi:glutamate formiminotransferase
MVAYNLWLGRPDLALARSLAASLRSPAVRALAFTLGREVQLSFNLLSPLEVGPAEVMDTVRAHVAVAKAELVGLVPSLVLKAVPRGRWPELGLSEDLSIEHRLLAAGLGP